VILSFYEVYITCLRALNAMGFPHGSDEEAAYLITWLELNKLKGVKELTKLSKQMDGNFQGKIDLEEIKSKKFINLKNASLLMKGPSLFDYFLEKTKKIKNFQIILENCIDPIIILPLAEKLSINVKLIHACWINNNKKKLVNISKNKILIGEMKNDIDIKKKQVLIKFSTKGLSKFNKITKLDNKNIKCKINKISLQSRLKNALSPNLKDWKILSNFANKTFVPASTKSRAKGAGGGDDND